MPLADINLDGFVTLEDLKMAAKSLGQTRLDPAWLDLNMDGVVNILDLVIIGSRFGGS
jgi:hypothetical protein